MLLKESVLNSHYCEAGVVMTVLLWLPYVLALFAEMNIHGHASDSSAQKLLYGQGYGSGRMMTADQSQGAIEHHVTTSADFTLTMETAFMTYESNFDYLGKQVNISVS